MSAAAGHLLAGSDFVRTATATTDSDSPPPDSQNVNKASFKLRGRRLRKSEEKRRGLWKMGEGEGGKAALAIYPSIFHFRRGRRSRKREGRHHAPTRCGGTQTYRFNMNLFLPPPSVLPRSSNLQLRVSCTLFYLTSLERDEGKPSPCIFSA